MAAAATAAAANASSEEEGFRAAVEAVEALKAVDMKGRFEEEEKEKEEMGDSDEAALAAAVSAAHATTAMPLAEATAAAAVAKDEDDGEASETQMSRTDTAGEAVVHIEAAQEVVVDARKGARVGDITVEVLGSEIIRANETEQARAAAAKASVEATLAKQNDETDAKHHRDNVNVELETVAAEKEEEVVAVVSAHKSTSVGAAAANDAPLVHQERQSSSGDGSASDDDGSEVHVEKAKEGDPSSPVTNHNIGDESRTRPGQHHASSVGNPAIVEMGRAAIVDAAAVGGVPSSSSSSSLFALIAPVMLVVLVAPGASCRYGKKRISRAGKIVRLFAFAVLLGSALVASRR